MYYTAYILHYTMHRNTKRLMQMYDKLLMYKAFRRYDKQYKCPAHQTTYVTYDLDTESGCQRFRSVRSQASLK